MRDVVLRLRTVAYEKARDLVGAVGDRADRALSTARRIGEEVRGAAERGRDLGGARGRARGGGAGSGADPRRVIGALNEAREKGESGFNALSRGSLPALLTLVGGVAALGVGGPLLRALAPLVEPLLEELEKRFDSKLNAREAAFTARFERERRESDYTQRLADDPDFRRSQARLALEQILAEEARGGRRIEALSDVVTDFGF